MTSVSDQKPTTDSTNSLADSGIKCPSCQHQSYTWAPWVVPDDLPWGQCRRCDWRARLTAIELMELVEQATTEREVQP